MRAALSRCAAALAVAAAMSGAACGGAVAAQEGAATPRAAVTSNGKTAPLELVKGSPKRAEEIASEEADNGAPNPSGGRVVFPHPNQQLGIPLEGGRRDAVSTEPFRVADLPRADIPEPLAPSQAPIVSTEGEPATDLYVDWDTAYRSNSMLGRGDAYTSVRVSLRGHNLARLRIGNNEGAVTAGAGGGVYVVCRVAEDSVRRFVTARWESLGPGASGGATLSVVDAWFDMHTCKATIVRKTHVALKGLAGGIFFGYREACRECPGGERVVFLTPNPQHIAAAGVGGEATTTLGTVSRVILPVRKGGGGSVVVRHSAGVLTDWLATLGKDPLSELDVLAGIDIVQGVEDAEPIAIAYASKTVAPPTRALGMPKPRIPPRPQGPQPQPGVSMLSPTPMPIPMPVPPPMPQVSPTPMPQTSAAPGRPRIKMPPSKQQAPNAADDIFGFR